MGIDRKASRQLIFNRKTVFMNILVLCLFLIAFRVSCYLITPPDSLDKFSLIFLDVVLFAMLFEFLDSLAGMGYGTAFTPVLLILGFEPLQIVPVVMVQQMFAGFATAYIHKSFGNVSWSLNPPSREINLCSMIALSGAVGASLSILFVYGFLQVDKEWVKLYIGVLLILLSVVSFVRRRSISNYHPKYMAFLEL